MVLDYKDFEKCKYFRWGGCLSPEKIIEFECCTKNKDCEFKKELLKKEKNFCKSMYHMEEVACGLDGDR